MRAGKGQDTAEVPPAHGHEASPTLIADRYSVEQRLTHGAIGEILRVVDRTTGRRLALKRMRGRPDKQAVMLFEREYYTLASLKHPRIVEVYEYGIDGTPFYTMELLEGQDLRHAAPLSYHDVCRYLRDVASSLALLHARHLLHRDVSARNVRLTPDGRCKLLDFGALTYFGVPDEIIGTAPCVPPEALHSLALDQRVDLYALGALGYWLLTCRHAYPAREFADLPELWRKPLAPPSAFVRGVPEQLEQLLLSLLSHDRSERPASAAEVIERLNAIAKLEPENDDAIVQSYLASPRLVGRSQVLDTFARSIAKLQHGYGGALMMSAASGLGKSRLLDDMALSASFAGAVVLRVDSELHRGAFGVAQAVAEALLRAAPSDARRAAGRNTALLAQLFPTLRDGLIPDASAELGENPGERRARIQTALQEWLRDFCSERLLAVLVDNVQAADQGSVGFLLGLAKESARKSILLVTTLRGSDEVEIDGALRKLQNASLQIELPPLNPGEVHDLAASLFGDVPNLVRFAEWLHVSTSGNPLCCVELARQAVDQKTVLYVEGAWVLPDALPRETAVRAEGISAHVLQQLSREARTLAEALSVHNAAIRSELCATLAEESGLSAKLFPLLEELISHGILSSEAKDLRFRHESIRAALLRGLDEQRKKQLHRSLAEALLAGAEGLEIETQVEAGWHLMSAGEQARGAQLLAQVAGDLGSLGAHTDLHAAVPALEAALRVYKEEGRSLYDQAPLLGVLVVGGYYVDWRLAHRYGDEAVAAFRKLLGLELAAKLRPFIGARLSLTIAVLVARIRFGFGAKKPVAFKDLFVSLLACCTALAGISVILLDANSARRAANVLAPFKVIGERLAPAGLHQYCESLALVAENRLSEARKSFQQLLERLRNKEHYYRSLPEETREVFISGALFLLGLLEGFRDSEQARYYADAQDELGLKFFQMLSCRVRIAHHAHRGEMELARPYRERLDLYAIQFGSAWQVDLWEPMLMLAVCSNLADVLGLKHTAERIANMPKELPRFTRHGELCTATYQLLRGDTEGALARLEQLRDEGAFSAYPGVTSSWGTLAMAYNHARQHEKAKVLCENVLATLSEEDREFVVFTLKLELQLALAEAGLGNATRAAQICDGLIERFGHDRGPVTLARLHQTRAQVALMNGDQPTFEQHLRLAETAVRAANHPALLHQWMCLARRGAYAGESSLAAQTALGHMTERARLSASSAQRPQPRDASAAFEEPEEMTQTTGVTGGAKPPESIPAAG